MGGVDLLFINGPGEFQPTEKCTSVRAKQQVRQVRRLDSISRMLVKHGDHQQPTVQQDWNAVCRAKGFLPDFSTWCGEALLTYPTLGIVQQLAEKVRTSIQTLEAESSKASRQRWSDALNKSWKTQGNKLAHKVTAKGSNPFLTMASQIHQVECHRLRARGKHRARFVLPADQRRQYHELTLANGEPDCKASGTLFSQSKEHTLTITRKVWHYRPEDVQDQFFQYWAQFWGQEDPDGGALSRCRIPDEWKIDGCHLLTPDTFADALKGTRNNSAAGADSWRIPEIQALGQVALGCWTQYFNHILIGVQPWPEAMCWARVVLPGKTAEPNQIKDGRPVTILPALYRISMKAVTHSILLHLSSKLPPQVAGGLPHRDSESLWYSTQFTVEKCNLNNSPLHGAVTDIQKFFSGLPRAQLATLMLDFGFPEPLVRQWFILLSQLKRSVIVQGDYSFPQRSVCGVPEGDPLSVAAAVVVGAQLLHVIQQRTQALLLVYIDNVELISRDETQICQATDLTLDFFQQWGLKIDLAKSWAWSNVPTRKIGEKNRFQYSSAKTNLGCYSKYRKSTIHGEFGDRLATATKRAAAIAALPYDLDGRMQAIEAGAFAAGFYASEVHYIGKRKLSITRTAVTKAIIKPAQGVNHKVAIQTYEDGHFEPTLVAVRRACTTARRAFARYPDQFSDFWDTVHSSDGNPKKAFGPASVLAAYFSLLGVQTSEDQQVSIPDGTTLHFYNSCPVALFDMLKRQWRNHVHSELGGT